MKRALVTMAVLVFLGALGGGGVWLWGRRPWRMALSVNGRVLTAGELEMRAQTLYNDAVRTKRLTVPPGKEAEVFQAFRKEAAQRWIVKEVLLGEAVACGTTATPADEQDALAQLAGHFQKRNQTVEEYFREGPLSEEVKRRDFREQMLIDLFMRKKVGEKVSVTSEEVDRLVSKIASDAGRETMVKKDRKTAINMLRSEKYNQEYRRLFRALFVKADVKCPACPELESVDGVSPPRPEDAAEGTSKEKNTP